MNFDSFDISTIVLFEWDEGNTDKNKRKYNLYK